MLDLVVQSSKEDIADGVRSDISGSNHLAAQVAHSAALVQDGHAFVVRSEDQAHIHTHKSLMGNDKQHCLPGFESIQEQAYIRQYMDKHEHYFNNMILLRLIL